MIGTRDWCFLYLDPKTDEADMRRTCANKIKGEYRIHYRFYGKDREYVPIIEIADMKEIPLILDLFDVIDREYCRQRTESS